MILRVETVPEFFAAVLHVQGSVDGDTYGELLMEAQQLLIKGSRRLILDLQDCEYMSSAGIMALTSTLKKMREMQLAETGASWATKNVLDRAGALGPARELILTQPRAAVDRVLEMAGVNAYLRIFPDVSSALTALHSGT